MLYLVMVCYNDFPLIERAISSVYDHVDEIIAVDGKFKEFPQMGGSDWSSDGTVEYLMGLDKVHLIFAENKSEVEKRNIYLIGDRNDWYLHLDADEEWLGGIVCPASADMMVCPLKIDTSPKKKFPIMDRVRIFRHVPGLHYSGKHYWLKDGQNRTFALLDKPGNKYKAEKFNSIKILHHEPDRNVERQSAKRKYYKHLYKFEGAIKETMD